MAYNIALQFEDGVSRIIKCEPNELVCDAAYKVKINIPLDCRDGACGTCKCHCESGDYEMGGYIEDALTEDEAAKGKGSVISLFASTEAAVYLLNAKRSDLAEIEERREGCSYEEAVVLEGLEAFFLDKKAWANDQVDKRTSLAE